MKKDRTRHNNRIKGLLVGQGIRLAIKDDFLDRLDAVRTWDGSPLPPGLQIRIRREYERMKLAGRQIKELEMERIEAIRHSEDPSVDMVRQLLKLKGIGLNSAWLYTLEFFSWLRFTKALGSLLITVIMASNSFVVVSFVLYLFFASLYVI